MKLWKYKDYIAYSVRARLLSDTGKNHLGVLWLLFEPILRMFVFYFVFVFLIKRRTEDFTSYLLIGIITISWFSKSVQQAGNSINGAGKLMKQLHMPKLIFPIITFSVRTVEFLIVLTCLLSYFVIRGQVHLTWLAIPAVILTQLLFTYGVVLFTAGIIPFVPDMSFLVSSVLSALFFLSGVFYRITPSNPNYKIFMLNPLAKLLEQYRQVILYKSWPEWDSLAIISCIGVFMIIVMTIFIKKMDLHYPRRAK